MTKISFDKLAGWENENHLAAFKTFCHMQCHMQKTNAAKKNITTNKLAKKFFEQNFRLEKISASGKITAYFQPKVFGSLKKTARFSQPLYKLPNNFNKNKIYKYNRCDIQNGALANKNLELVFVENAIIAFFIHVQGCAEIILPTGKSFYINFAGKTGHKYISLGKLLAKQLNIAENKMSAQKLKTWLYKNPTAQKNFLAQNPSYIFFKQITKPIIGAANVPLIKYRSIAVDNNFHKFGAPIWLDSEIKIPKMKRLMFAHDIGSAIKGQGRFDIFMGTGERAEKLAGTIRHECKYVLFIANER